jgi:DNA-3-methyladenine glycosylase II
VAGGRAARRHLCAADPQLGSLIRRLGPCELRADVAREPFESLIRAIAHQQLHARAANAMLGRLVALVPDAFPTPDALLALPDSALRSCGFSGAKAAAMRAVCEARLAGIVPTRRQALRLSDEELVARLVPLRGIGRWTVEMLLIFSLGRRDVMPVDDFGVREGFRRIKGLPVQPKPRALAEATAAWAPWRSFAAWYLWRAADEPRPSAGAGIVAPP